MSSTISRDHPDFMKIYMKEWYIRNKDKHLQYCAQKISCTCGKSIRYSSLQRHLRSAYHKKRV